jgi:transcriptional regulator with XRE-family HTH domain
MQRERVTQRALAASIGVSQGHLSKVLRGKTDRDTHVLASLELWSASATGHEDEEAGLLEAARMLAKGQPRAMSLLMRLMQLLVELRQPASPSTRRRPRSTK